MRDFEPPVILLPEQIMQKDAHGIQTQGLGPTKFEVDSRRDRTWRLPTSRVH